jgi:aryl-alcohol dehydrogenase-like predicted oxidoreductase
MAQTYGAALIPWAPAAGGFFTEKYVRNQPAPSDSRYGAFWRGFYRDGLSQDQVFEIQKAVLDLAGEKSVSGYALALAWCLSKSGITSPIIGPRTTEQLTDSLTALEIELDETDQARLNEAALPESVTVSYSQYKGAHLYRW